MQNYRLRCQLYGHEADVRCVACISDGIVSASRDKTTRIWRPSGSSFEQHAVLRDHQNFVVSICYIPPNEKFSEGLLATGSNDKTICVYAPVQATLLFKLEGHEQT
ncbi:unnamed protein product, partial [Didymodactylos carnosus]